jgi:phosphatidylinositol-3,4,5-trisphosphate 5-phosphatase 1
VSFRVASVLQLIKSQKFLNKLVILVETEKEKILRKEYVFADSKVSENQLFF